MAYYVRKLAKGQSQHSTLQSRNRNTQSRIPNFLKNYYHHHQQQQHHHHHQQQHHHHHCHRHYYYYICTRVCNIFCGMAISLSLFRKEVVFRVVPRELLKSCRRHFRDQAVYNRPWRDLLIADWIGPVINEGPWNAWTARDEPTDLPSNSLQHVRGTKEFVTPCQKKPATDGGSISSLSNILIRLARIYYLPSIVPITHIEKNGVKGICLWSGLFEGIYVIQHCLPRYLAAEIAFEPGPRIWFDRIHFNYRSRYLLRKELRIVFNRFFIDSNNTLVEIIYHRFWIYFRQFRFPTNDTR